MIGGTGPIILGSFAYLIQGCSWSAATGVLSLRYEVTAGASANAHGYGAESRKFNGMCAYPTERDPYEMKMVECRLVTSE